MIHHSLLIALVWFSVSVLAAALFCLMPREKMPKDWL